MIKQNKIILNLMIQKLLRRMTSFLDQNQCWNQGEIHCLWSCVFCAKSADRHSIVQCVLNSERLTDKTDHWLPLGMLPKLKLQSECNFHWLFRVDGVQEWLLTSYKVNIKSGPKLPKGNFGPELMFTKQKVQKLRGVRKILITSGYLLSKRRQRN